MKILSGRNILITGSSRGIGRIIALEAAKAGANIGIHYQYSEREAVELADEIDSKFGVKVVAISAQLEVESEIESLVSTVGNELGGIDGLVCNAASGNRKNLLQQKSDDWNRISGINVLAPIQCVRYALPYLEKSGGRVVMISSEGARFGIPHYGAIGVTKAALEASIRQLTVELGDDSKVSINGLSATLVRTLALDAVTRGETETYAERYFVSMEDIAKTCNWMLSDLCPKSLRGEVIRLDNGTMSTFIPVKRS